MRTGNLRWVGAAGLLLALSAGCMALTTAPQDTVSTGRTASFPAQRATPSAPERYDVTRLADNLGVAYIQGDGLFQEPPGKPPKRLLTLAEGTSVEAVEPHLRYVLLHERYNFLGIQQAGNLPTPMLNQGKPDPGSRLVYQSLEQGGRRILLPHFYHYNMQVAIAPDGRTLAVLTQLEPTASGDQDLYLLDVESAELSPFLLGRRVYQLKWSPDSLFLAIQGAADVRSPTELSVVERATKTLRTLKTFEKGGSEIVWLGESRLLCFRPENGRGTLEGLDGVSEEFNLDVTSVMHLSLGEASPDGSQVLGTAYVEKGQAPRPALLSIAERRLRLLSEGERWPRWATGSATLVCGEATAKGAEPCRLEP